MTNTKLRMIWAIIMGRSVAYRLNIYGYLMPRTHHAWIVENNYYQYEVR